jgi:hypothetical protein
METPEKFATEAESIFRKWLDKTIEALEYERIKLKVQDSKDLKDSLRSTVMQVAEGELGGQIHFLTRGRFVDAGKGRQRKVSALDYSATSERRIKQRKPKKWYSRTFYGKLNDLQGAVGIRLMERSLESFRNQLEQI